MIFEVALSGIWEKFYQLEQLLLCSTRCMVQSVKMKLLLPPTMQKNGMH